ASLVRVIVTADGPSHVPVGLSAVTFGASASVRAVTVLGVVRFGTASRSTTVCEYCVLADRPFRTYESAACQLLPLSNEYGLMCSPAWVSAAPTTRQVICVADCAEAVPAGFGVGG